MVIKLADAKQLDWRTGNGLPGRGPWRILEDCPARLHNTIHAGRGRAGQIKCICPRAIAAVLEFRKKEERRRIEAKGQNITKTPEYTNNVVQNVERPDFHHAACATPEGRMIMDERSSSGNPTVEACVLAARMCAECPINLECARWVLSAEKPAGSWGGFYAGMTPTDRRKIAKGAVAA